MQLNSEIITTPPRASATVVLLRDEPHKGLQVFLLRRHTASAVLGGAFVFPGGKLDEADCSPEVHTYLDASPPSLHQALGEVDLSEQTAAGLYVAAVREVLEECGVLYARSSQSQALAHDAGQRQNWQQALHGGQSFAEVLQCAELRIDTQHLAPWSRWITPVQPSVTNKRFDTRFFVTQVPDDQLADTAQRLQANLDHLVGLPLAHQVSGPLARTRAAWMALEACAADPAGQRLPPGTARMQLLEQAESLAEALLAEADTLTAELELASGRRNLTIINLCGRQRMLSQRLAKQALLAGVLPEPAAALALS